MLSFLRKNTKIVMWILLALIVPPFLFFGIGSVFSSKEDRPVGLLFGRKVLLSEFIKVKTATLAIMQLRQQPVSLQSPYFDQITWQKMIVLEQGRKLGLKVTNDELSKTILNIFSTQGPFDSKVYEYTIQDILKMSVLEFERSVRDDLIVQKMRDLVFNLVDVTDQEARELFFYDEEKWVVRYCEIPSERFLDQIKLDEDALKKYYDEHSEDFRVADQRKVEYVAVSIDSFLTQVKIAPVLIEKYYQTHRELYEKKALNEVSTEIETILKTEKTQKRAKTTARKIYQLLLKGGAFEKAAEKYHLSSETSDFFTQSDPPPMWKNTLSLTRDIFKEEIHQPLSPALVGNVYYVVRPVEVKKSYIPAYEESRGRVKDSWMGEKAKEMAGTACEELIKKIQDLMAQKISFKKACEHNGEKSAKIPPFSRLESRGMDELNGLKMEALNVPIHGLSKSIRTQKGYAVLTILKSIPPDPKNYEKSKGRYLEKVRSKKRQKIFYDIYRRWSVDCPFYGVNTAQN